MQPERNIKVVVFAHTPPPLHGQSYMVQLVLDGLGGDRRGRTPPPPGEESRIECFHVNARVSGDLDEIGRFHPKKLLLLLKYCAEAWFVRVRHGADLFFYIPAPKKRSAIYRDWIVMLLCRPWFRRTVYYWQAAGLGEWLDQEAHSWERWITRRLLGRPDLSIVMGEACRSDALAFSSLRTEVVPNAVPDPCPDFDLKVLPRRRARESARRKLLSGGLPDSGEITASGGDPQVYRVGYLSLCCREKGLFDALEAVALLNTGLQAACSPVRIELIVAGKFREDAERIEFEQRIRRPDLEWEGRPVVYYRGFVTGDAKRRLFVESDCFCFPTFYEAESFGIVMIEAMAFGLPVIATRWRTVPERFPDGYEGLVDIKAPEQIATVLKAFLQTPPDRDFRAFFLKSSSDKVCLDSLKAALTALQS